MQCCFALFACAEDRLPAVPDTGMSTTRSAHFSSVPGEDASPAETRTQGGNGGNGKFVAADEGWSVGIGVGAAESPYKSYDVQWMPLPLISYEGEYAYIRGVTAGLKLLNREYVEVSAFVGYDGTNFDSSDTSNRQLKRLDNRHSSAVAGVRTRVATPVGMLEAGAAGDILGNSNGFKGDVEYNYSIEYEPVELVMTAGFDWSTSKYQDYYYGVDGGESRKSGLREYHPGAGVTPYLGASVVVSPTERIDVFCSGKVNFLNDNIKDSPMVSKERTHSVTGGIVYNF